LSTDAAREASRWRLRVPQRRLGGLAGDRLGRGLGSSVEFEDHRAYQPGDDPRHVDWRAYARTDRLDVRRYREEVSPDLDAIVDTSASMGVTAEKAATVRGLCQSVEQWAAHARGRARVLAAGGGGLVPAGTEPELNRPSEPLPPAGVRLRPRGVRLVVSDFLRPADHLAELSRIADGGAHLFVVQVLAPVELEPQLLGAVTLVDVEERTRVDLQVDDAAIAAYRQRLARLRAEVVSACARLGATYALVTAGGFDAVCAQLGRQEVLEPA
jgi:uncharacterized protein (DUF58 family)